MGGKFEFEAEVVRQLAPVVGQGRRCGRRRRQTVNEEHQRRPHFRSSWKDSLRPDALRMLQADCSRADGSCGWIVGALVAGSRLRLDQCLDLGFYGVVTGRPVAAELVQLVPGSLGPIGPFLDVIQSVGCRRVISWFTFFLFSFGFVLILRCLATVGIFHAGSLRIFRIFGIACGISSFYWIPGTIFGIFWDLPIEIAD